MAILAKLFYTILFSLGGAMIIKYRKQIFHITGGFYWAEKYIGRGGTYIIIIAVGLFMMFYGVSYFFGAMNIAFGI